MLGAETEKRARTRLQRISGMGPGPPPSLGLSPPDNQMWVTEVLPRAARTQCMALIFCEPSPDRAVGSAGSWGRSVQDTDGTRSGHCAGSLHEWSRKAGALTAPAWRTWTLTWGSKENPLATAPEARLAPRCQSEGRTGHQAGRAPGGASRGSATDWPSDPGWAQMASDWNVLGRGRHQGTTAWPHRGDIRTGKDCRGKASDNAQCPGQPAPGEHHRQLRDARGKRRLACAQACVPGKPSHHPPHRPPQACLSPAMVSSSTA
nr:uncharacterized protein LOC112580226 isoform X1 [Bubalus bubalis]